MIARHRNERAYNAVMFERRFWPITLVVLTVFACAITLLAQARLRTRVYATGFSSPIAFVQDPLDRSVQFVVEQGGRIRAVRSGIVLANDFLDLRNAVTSGGERGLLGMAFAPDAQSGRFYVNFTNRSGDTVVARFRRTSDPVIGDIDSRFDLRWGGPNGTAVISQPFSNHNGGHLAFGPDGFLYIGLGDGGSGGDPDNRAQNPNDLLGKMLRIDVNVPDTHATGYQIPSNNPFVSGGPVAARHEIWAFGLRNPWRYSFDDPSRGGTGAMLIADVGQGGFEEVSYEPPNRGGRNYGWRVREGAHPYNGNPPAPYQPLIDPIHEYGRNVGQSITGGYVYRGTALGSAYVGRYFFADYVQARVWSFAITTNAQGEGQASGLIDHTADLGGTSTLGNISSFGVDRDGELYIVSHSRGVILGITGSLPAPVAPTNLRIVTP
jgi:glucose/arabinose dehydrogenase